MCDAVKKAALPILIIIPHGGISVPEELAGYEKVTPFDLFMQSDACANDIFSFGKRVAGTLTTNISRLFVDLDRPYTALGGGSEGVIKRATLDGMPVFLDNHFPDEIAIANIIHRYYIPYHDAIAKIIETGAVSCILECHTMTPVGQKAAKDAGKPRPLALIETIVSTPSGAASTCPDEVAIPLQESLKKALMREECATEEKVVLSRDPSGGYILCRYGRDRIPMIRLSLSRALFINEQYFNFDFVRVDERRIAQLRELVWEVIRGWYARVF